MYVKGASHRENDVSPHHSTDPNMKTRSHLVVSGLVLLIFRICLGQPVITTQPQSCTNLLGTVATLSVGAIGTEPLAYQWQKLGAGWSDIAGCTATDLSLTNVQTSHAGDYRVVIANIEGAVTSAVVHLTILVPPRIIPAATFQHQALDLGTKASFTVNASGSGPLRYQWRRDGAELVGQTSNSITFTAVQKADEGDYTVLVTNLAGSLTSEAVRLWVVPTAAAFIKGNLTNAVGRLPYFYVLPTNYTTLRAYPLWLNFHGIGYDESGITNPIAGWPGYAQASAMKTLISYRQQELDPVILLWPTRRAGDSTWTDAYLRQASALLDQFIVQYNVDTNRIFVSGQSEGVHAAWDMIGLRPGCFAGAGLSAGWPGNARANFVKDVPIWAWCAADDDYGQLPNTQALVSSLRQAGGSTIYTEYSSAGAGAHVAGICMGMATPVIIDWLLIQRRGVAPTNEPLLSITEPTCEGVRCTGAISVSLAGTASASGQVVRAITWTNFANKAKGVASGTNLWSATNIPLVASRTNIVVVVGTTTSWAPAYGGNTTFNDALSVIQAPLRATLAWQGANALLNWTGGGPPYCVQRATNLAAGDWADLLPNATPPVALPSEGQIGFYRIIGQ